ncbi:uncharacterized protein [Hoplias malabaricus]|uniref:uncharacterized protein n=1 Tax=Hoplias malabaricus TaxID=27720 RepID=UPI0034621380
MTSRPVQRQPLPSPQQAASMKFPGPTSQTAHGSVEQRTVIQWNNHQYLALSNGQSFITYSQPSSSSSNLTSSQAPQALLTGSQNQLFYGNPETIVRASYRPPSHNEVVQFQQIPPAQQVPTLIICNPPLSSNKNPSPQGYNTVSSVQNTIFRTSDVYFPPVIGSDRSVLKNNLMLVSVPPRYEPRSGQQKQIQTKHPPASQPQHISPNPSAIQAAQRANVCQSQIKAVRNGASHETAQAPTAAVLPPSYWSNHYVISKQQASHNVNLFQNSPTLNQCQTSSNQTHNISVAQNQSNGFPKGSPHRVSWKTSVPQHKVQSQVFEMAQRRQATPNYNTLSGPNGVPSFPVNQCNTEPQKLQSTGEAYVLTMTTHASKSCFSSTSQPPLSAGSRPINYSQMTWLDLLLQDENIPLSSVSNCFRGQSTEVRSGVIQRVGRVSRGVDRPVNKHAQEHYLNTAGVEGTVEGSQVKRLQTDKDSVACSTISADCLDLLLPPIVQRPQPGQKEDIPIKADNSPLFKADYVWTVVNNSKSIATDTIAATCSEELIDIAQLPQRQEVIMSEKGSTDDTESSEMPTSEKTPTSGSDLKRLSPPCHVWESDVTSPSQFRPWWKVEGMPADIDKVLAEPISDYDFTWWKDSSQSVFDGAVNPVDSPVHFSPNDTEDAVVSIQTDLSKETPEYTLVQNSGIDATQKGATETSDNAAKPNVIPSICHFEPNHSTKLVIPATVDHQDHLMMLKRQVNLLVSEAVSNRIKQSVFVGTLNPVKSHVQVSRSNTEHLVVSSQKQSSVATSEDIALSSVDHEVQNSGTDAEDLAVSTHKETTDNAPALNVIQDVCHLEPSHSSEVVMSVKVDHQNDLAMPKLPVNVLGCEAKSNPNEQSVFYGTVNLVEGLVRVSRNNTEDLDTSTQKELSVATPESTTLSPVDCGPKVVPEADYKTKDHRDTELNVVSPSLIPKSKPNNLLEQTMPTETEQTHREFTASPLLLSDFDRLENDGNSCEKQDIPDADSSSDSLQIDYIVLSPDGAKEIFNKCNKLKHSTKHPLNMPSLSQPDNLSTKAVTPPVRVKFTCPHVTDIISDDVHFCTKCWEQTPLLDVNLDDSQSTQNEDESPVTIPLKPLDERCSPQPGEQTQDPVETSCPDNGRISDSVVFNPRVNDCEMTVAPVEPSEPRKRSVQEPTRAVSLESEKPGSELPKVLPHSGIPEQVRSSLTKKLIQSVLSPKYPPCKKRKISKIQAESIFDEDLFRPDIVKTDSCQQHPRLQGSTATGDGRMFGHERNEKERQSSTMTTIQMKRNSTETEHDANHEENKVSIKPQNVKQVGGKPEETSRSALSNTETIQHQDLGSVKQTGQKRTQQVVKLSLYGSKSSSKNFLHQCHAWQQLPFTVPVHVTVSTVDNAGRSYTDALPTKQKVYSQWSQSIFHPVRNPKKVWERVQERTEIQKQGMRARAMSKSLSGVTWLKKRSPMFYV